MIEEMIDINVRLDKSTIDKLNRMTKKELIEKICVTALECKVAQETAKTFEFRCTVAIEDSDRAERKIDAMQAQLDDASSHIKQGKAMINAITQRWSY